MIISRYKPRSYTNELSVVADNIFEEYRYKNDDGQSQNLPTFTFVIHLWTGPPHMTSITDQHCSSLR